MDHLKHSHVEQQTGEKFHCLWEGCKVYNQSSSSKSWLERHILTHSGDKLFEDHKIMFFIFTLNIPRGLFLFTLLRLNNLVGVSSRGFDGFWLAC
jgi:uncharacterized Zn-finger protein